MDTISIGNQDWATKNLDVEKYCNGDIIPEVKDKNEWYNIRTGAWCYYDNNIENGVIYGKIYNWYAVIDPRGLAPNGFHIPSSIEWDELINFLGGNEVAGEKLKNRNIYKAIENGNTESGFSGLLGGKRMGEGTFYGMGGYGHWWSASETEGKENYALDRYLFYKDNKIGFGDHHKFSGFYVRCIKN